MQKRIVTCIMYVLSSCSKVEVLHFKNLSYHMVPRAIRTM